ncbi:MAG: hypothetical protein AAF663_02875 [Planctomycetota bacterium]
MSNCYKPVKLGFERLGVNESFFEVLSGDRSPAELFAGLEQCRRFVEAVGPGERSRLKGEASLDVDMMLMGYLGIAETLGTDQLRSLAFHKLMVAITRLECHERRSLLNMKFTHFDWLDQMVVDASGEIVAAMCKLAIKHGKLISMS